MLKCFSCGLIFKDDDLQRYIEDTGETWGMCPACGSNDIGEVTICDRCGQWKEEMVGSTCRECMQKEYKGEDDV